jgi:adenylate cyclase
MPNETKKATRKLRAILSADVKGYSLLMADDEVHTIETLKKYRGLMSELITHHSGRVVDNPGDNLLAELSSAVDAVETAVQIQNKLKKENAKFVEDKRLEFRIGVNIGDVVHDGDRIYGEVVNIAARIESLADAGGVCISRSTYDQIKNKLDIQTKYLGEHEVKNIQEPVRVYKVLMVSDEYTPLVKEKLELPDKPSIAVLPFTNMSGDPAQEYFSDGLTEQIINGLCKIRKLFVIARNSSFAYKGKAVSVKQIAQELGVKYILEGSVQRAGDRVRITAQLIDATTDFHMFSKTYDRDLEDIFALQDEITLNIIKSMEVTLTVGEQAYSWEATSTNIQAYDNFMKAHECIIQFEKDKNAQARNYAMDAIKYDQQYTGAYFIVGMTYLNDSMFGWHNSPLNSFEKAEQFADKAISLPNKLESAYILSAWIGLYKREFDEVLTRGKLAIELSPSGADVHMHYGSMLSFMEDNHRQVGLQLMKRAFRLNPMPDPYYYSKLQKCHRTDLT